MVSDRKGKINTKGGGNPEGLFLGVDGGGTKTLAVLLDTDSKIVAEGLSGASNPMRVGIEKAIANISEAVNNACDLVNQIPGNIVSAVLGLAGVRRSDLRSRVRDRFIRELRIKLVDVLTDADIALFGAIGNEPGLVIIAGTGSICLGQNGGGKKAISGGWGPLAGDEGSGAGIARKALQAIAKASDHRGPGTLLSQKATEYFRAGKPEDLIVAIYAPQMDNMKIAGFARYVVEAARENDPVARMIMVEAGEELGVAALAVIRELELCHEKFPIAKVGGMFQAGELLTDPLIKRVHQLAERAFLTEPFLPPAEGAARLARNIFLRETGKKGTDPLQTGFP